MFKTSILMCSGLLVLLLVLRCRAFIIREIIVNEPMTLLCTCSGNRSAVQWTCFIPSEAVVAEIRMCRSEQRCEKSFSLSGETSRGNFSLMISSVAYSDAGSYRCRCGGESVTDITLKVLDKCTW